MLNVPAVIMNGITREKAIGMLPAPDARPACGCTKERENARTLRSHDGKDIQEKKGG
jgi:hypothetical protein